MGKKGRRIIQFVEREKRQKKGVDNWSRVWYYNKAVARESEKAREKGSGSGPEGIQRHKA